MLCAGFSLVVASRGHPSLQCADFSLGGLSRCRARALGVRASVVVALRLSSCGSWAPERRLSSCGARAPLLHGMWDRPRPGLEPMSPASAGGLPTTAPPGKPLYSIYTPIKMWGKKKNEYKRVWTETGDMRSIRKLSKGMGLRWEDQMETKH